jgi:glycosyltransferase involved in cell wall biosynthesis
MRISVVVPVYDPGRYVLDLLASLRAQTLDRTEWEAVLVDDGSSDGTPALLDRFAEELPNVRVIHTPNSGWPGRPRNIGLDAARGDYVFFSDADDRLDPEALQRLSDFAIEHGSDVVIGRIVGVGRNAPVRIFERTLVDAQRNPGLLMSSLTPQKLFRRAFLDEHGIRFPEGRRRLEDQVFVTTAYLRAKRVSVYADHPVYYFTLRADGGNISRRPVEWPGYFANAAECVALVDAEAPDERIRLLMRSRWLKTEAIGRLRGRRFAERPDQRAVLTAVGDFVRTHYVAAEVDRLGPHDRMIGRLLLDGRDDDVVALAEWEASVEPRLEVVDARVVDLRVEVGLRAAARRGRQLPRALRQLPDGYPDAAALERVVVLPAGTRVTARFQRPDGALLDAEVLTAVQDGVLDATVRLELDRDPPIAEGRWRLRTTMKAAGPARTESPSGARAAGASLAPQPVRIGDRRFALAVGRGRPLVLRVERRGVVPAVRRTAARAIGRARQVRSVVLRRLRRPG